MSQKDEKAAPASIGDPAIDKVFGSKALPKIVKPKKKPAAKKAPKKAVAKKVEKKPAPAPKKAIAKKVAAPKKARVASKNPRKETSELKDNCAAYVTPEQKKAIIAYSEINNFSVGVRKMGKALKLTGFEHI